MYCGLVLAANVRGAGMEVVARTADQRVVVGEVVSFSRAEGLVLSTDGAESMIPTVDLVRLTTRGERAARGDDYTVLGLVNGDHLVGRLVDARDGSVSIKTEDLGVVTVAADQCAQIDLGGGSAGQADAIRRFERVRDAGEDRVLLKNGDVLAGFVTAVGEESVSVDTPSGEMKVPHRVAVLIRFAAARAEVPPDPYVVLELRSSGRITAADVDWNRDGAEVRLGSGARARVPAGRIVELTVVGGRWESLAGKRPHEEQHTPMLGSTWAARWNRNVLGGPLAVAGVTYQNGIGVHSRSKLLYELNGAYRQFVTSFGIDDDSGAMADVSVSILVDGVMKFEQSAVRRGKLHGPVSLEIGSAQTLELVVDFGANGDMQDRLDWIEAAVVK